MSANIEELERDSTIQIVLDYLVLNNFEKIKADIYGYNLPAKIYWNGLHEGFTPDISCTKGDKKFIFRIETEYSIKDKNSEKIWKLFAANAGEFEREFHLIVPNNYQYSLRERLVNLQIKAIVEGINKYCRILT